MRAQSLRPSFLWTWSVLILAAALASGAPAGLPCGPEGPGRFGGYQTRLAFTPEWDAPWRLGPRSDVVVRFDNTPARLVYWHGANFVPCWVNEKGLWYSDGAVVRPGAGPHQDHLCRFSFASVVESSDARVVVRWRYAPADEKGELINADPVTRWNDWVDEFYTIYPDATAVRKVTLHSSEWSQPFWLQESILIQQPAEQGSPRALVPKTTVLAGGLVQWLELKGSKPFEVVSQPAGNTTLPASWGDWPAHGAAQKASHQFVGALQWKPAAEERFSKSWRMLVGLGGNESAMKRVAQAWLSAPALHLEGADFTSAGYQADEKAYLLQTVKPGAPGRMKLVLDASSASPLVNPAFVLKSWGNSGVSLALNGKRQPQGPDFRCGYRKSVTGVDLLVWLRVSATKPLTLEFQPAPKESE